MDTHKRKYEDALERAIIAHKDEDRHLKATLEGIFPELKKYEDEWMCNIAINACKYMMENFENSTKQYEDAIVWLEKQGEQKPVVVIPKFRIGDNIKTTNEEPLTITKIDGKGYWSEDLFICGFDDSAKWELVERKPTDKVEPKFKVGDWVVISTSDGEKVVQIDSIEYFKSGEPRYITSEGRWFGNGTKAHLWTIQDAKDGDVLFQDLMCGKTFIYNGVSPDMAILYSFIISNDGKDVLPCHIGKPNTGIGNIEENKNIIHPATKEQRDLLFKKMNEAGYEWDAEKKELKKIEQKSQRMISAEAKEAMYDKPVWSEEDKNVINHLIDICKIAKKFIQFASCTQDDIIKCQDWLTSLKERIQL